MKGRPQEIGKDPVSKAIWTLNDNIISLAGIMGRGTVLGVDVSPVVSDIANLINAGYIQVRGDAGDIKFTDYRGNIATLSFAADEVSYFKVKQIWSTGTTATGIVILY